MHAGLSGTHGKPLVAVGPIEDLEAREAIEDRTDIEEARKAVFAQ